jgi:cytochrome c-type biogenesis protein CcmI
VIWILATALLVVAAPVVLWPLLTHWQPEPDRSPDTDAEREHRLEEIELDVASGRIGEPDAVRRRQELS